MRNNIKNNIPIKSIQKNKNITLIIDGIQQKKGQDIVVIDLKNIMHSPCSFFVICSATSKTHINAIANNIEKLLLKKLKLKAWSQEGRSSNWRLIDYLDIVVHILKEETREYYRLEELWGDGIIKKCD
mgnify:CR=1 FL=1